MKKLLLAAAATAAFGFVAPAFAQLGGVVNNTTGAVAGQVTGSAQMSTAPVANGAADATDQTTHNTQHRVNTARTRVHNTGPSQVSSSNSGAVSTPAGSANGSMSAQAATPSTGAADAAVTSAENAAAATEQHASNTLRRTGAGASASGSASSSASANSRHASAAGQTSSQVALNTSLPSQVEEVVRRGHYTTEDLNRAQAAAAQSQMSAQPG